MCNDPELCSLIEIQTLEIQGLRSDLASFPSSIRSEFQGDYDLAYLELSSLSTVVQYAFWIIPPAIFFVLVYRYLREFLI